MLQPLLKIKGQKKGFQTEVKPLVSFIVASIPCYDKLFAMHYLESLIAAIRLL